MATVNFLAKTPTSPQQQPQYIQTSSPQPNNNNAPTLNVSRSSNHKRTLLFPTTSSLSQINNNNNFTTSTIDFYNKTNTSLNKNNTTNNNKSPNVKLQLSSNNNNKTINKYNNLTTNTINEKQSYKKYTYYALRQNEKPNTNIVQLDSSIDSIEKNFKAKIKENISKQNNNDNSINNSYDKEYTNNIDEDIHNDGNIQTKMNKYNTNTFIKRNNAYFKYDDINFDIVLNNYYMKLPCRSERSIVKYKKGRIIEMGNNLKEIGEFQENIENSKKIIEELKYKKNLSIDMKKRKLEECDVNRDDNEDFLYLDLERQVHQIQIRFMQNTRKYKILVKKLKEAIVNSNNNKIQNITEV